MTTSTTALNQNSPIQLSNGDLRWLQSTVEALRKTYSEIESDQLDPETSNLCIEYEFLIPVRHFDTLLGWFVAHHPDEVEFRLATEQERSEDRAELERLSAQESDSSADHDQTTQGSD